VTTPHQLRRSATSRVLGGVCGGLAEYFGLDPTLVRIIWIALTVFSAGFGGVFLYLIAWLVMPAPLTSGTQTPSAEPGTRALVGLLLVGVGVISLMVMALPWAFFRPWHWHSCWFPFSLRFLVPLLLLALGVVLIAVGVSNRGSGKASRTVPQGETAQPQQELEGDKPPLRRLYRSVRDRKIAGICGGLGEYLQTDPTVIRLLWILLVVMFGTGILLYLILWIVIPREPLSVSQTTSGSSLP